MSALSFEIETQDGVSGARLGRLTTPHGVIQTPAFVAVGTQATVKAIAPDDLARLGIQVLIANTYHLHLRPGEAVIQALGGLHRFMGWPGPIMTDSGGFQIFSLGAGIEHGVGKIASIFPEEAERGGHLKRAHQGESLVRVDEDGVSFRSHLDGSKQRFTPEGVIDMQRALGTDIMLVLDECTSPLHDYEYTREALERTHHWAERAWIRFHETESQAKCPQGGLYGIVQGGAYRDLREKSAHFIAERDFDGIAIGGSLGASKIEMHEVLDWTIPLLPAERPRHLLGIGSIPDIFEIVRRGIDTFDCVAPTRLARLGTLLVRGEPDYKLTITNARFERDAAPIDSSCDCYTCQNFSRGYLHHLFNAEELLAMRLATIHNLRFLTNLMVQIRRAIEHSSLNELQQAWVGASATRALSDGS